MKPRYFVKRPKADDDDYFWREPVAEHIPVVSDHEATDTGLIDRYSRYAQEMQQIHKEEWEY